MMGGTTDSTLKALNAKDTTGKKDSTGKKADTAEKIKSSDI
jgi:hypothetical protein